MKIDKFYFFLITILVCVLVIFWPIQKSLPFIDQNFSLFTITNPLSKEIVDVNHSQEAIPILMYHYIRDPDVQKSSIGKNLSVSPSSLEKHLKIIKAKGLTTTTLADWVNKKIVQPSIILTFDDGYSDFYTNAWPILKKYKARATIFIIKDKIDQPGYLTSNQIQKLSSQNVEIGSHSASHPNLTNISDANIKTQLEDSKSELEGITAKEVISFGYPSGKFDDRVIRAVKEAGYKIAVTTDSDVADLKNYTLYSLPRLRMKETTNFEKIFDDYNLWSI